MKSSALKVLLLSSMMAVFSFGTAFAQKYEFKLASVVSEDHPYGHGQNFFKDELAKRSNGNIVIQNYFGTLGGSERDLLESTQHGAIEMVLIASSVVSAYDKRFNLFNFPYLFDSPEHGFKAIDGQVGKDLEAIADKQGLKVIAWFINGVHSVTNSKRAINTVEDMKGLKLRCMESPVIIATWKSLGAVPTPMALGETFTALQQGTVDGQENATTASWANKYYEVQKYLGLTNHMFNPGPVVMNKQKFESLPKDVQDLLVQVGKEATAFQREEWKRQDALAVQRMKDYGLTVTTPDLAPFREAVKVVYDQYAKEMLGDSIGWLDVIRDMK
ncbi:MAG: TRAP transporter substrate-binding protein [Methylobacteriaceae bacterium]|jgi:tripartite ATP-independent transporter DctP family solute receptor|nr:TRAP transporter substrate-binding protein [Methylobacteriaceae bacterium]